MLQRQAKGLTDKDEELLEKLYWEFDSERNKGNNSERDIFKRKIKYFVQEKDK